VKVVLIVVVDVTGVVACIVVDVVAVVIFATHTLYDMTLYIFYKYILHVQVGVCVCGVLGVYLCECVGLCNVFFIIFLCIRQSNVATLGFN